MSTPDFPPVPQGQPPQPQAHPAQPYAQQPQQYAQQPQQYAQQPQQYAQQPQQYAQQPQQYAHPAQLQQPYGQPQPPHTQPRPASPTSPLTFVAVVGVALAMLGEAVQVMVWLWSTFSHAYDVYTAVSTVLRFVQIVAMIVAFVAALVALRNPGASPKARGIALVCLGASGCAVVSYLLSLLYFVR